MICSDLANWFAPKPHICVLEWLAPGLSASPLTLIYMQIFLASILNQIKVDLCFICNMNIYCFTYFLPSLVKQLRQIPWHIPCCITCGGSTFFFNKILYIRQPLYADFLRFKDDFYWFILIKDNVNGTICFVQTDVSFCAKWLLRK